MKYFALRDDNGGLITFGTTSADTTVGEITEEEYGVLLAAQSEKIAYAERVFNSEISIDDVPEECREAVAAIVKEMQNQPAPEPEVVSDIDEAIAILTGEVTE